MGNSAGKTNFGIVTLIMGVLLALCIVMLGLILGYRRRAKRAQQFLTYVEIEYVIDTVTAIDQASKGQTPQFKTLIEKAGATWGPDKGQIANFDELLLQCTSDKETNLTG